MKANSFEIPSVMLFRIFMLISFQSVDVLFLHTFTIFTICFYYTFIRNIEVRFLFVTVSSWDVGQGFLWHMSSKIYKRKSLNLITKSVIINWRHLKLHSKSWPDLTLSYILSTLTILWLREDNLSFIIFFKNSSYFYNNFIISVDSKVFTIGPLNH